MAAFLFCFQHFSIDSGSNSFLNYMYNYSSERINIHEQTEPT